MHVALVAPLVSPIHDDRAPLGGAQTVVGDLAHGLIERGHQVTVLAADGSYVRDARLPMLEIDSAALTPATFASIHPRVDTAEQTQAFQRVRAWLDDHRSELDLVHGHAFDAPCFLALDSMAIPVMHTLHLPPVDPEVVSAARSVAPRATMVAVSMHSADQWHNQDVSVRATIYAGLDIDSIPFRAGHGRYLLFAGRIAPEKGPHEAIAVAEQTGFPLVLIGDVYDAQYFETSIRPRARHVPDFRADQEALPGATYAGPRIRSELFEIMAHATGVLMPAQWDEPFGLVGVEAQATGTPVIAYRRGGLAEVVANGKTGWLVDPGDQAGLVQAVQKLDEICRAQCRQRASTLFGREQTIDRYLELYAQLTSENEARGH